MKTLIAYYSRSGSTRKVAEALSKALKCDTEEIIDTVNRTGILGYLRSGYGAARKRLTVLEKQKHDQSSYDLVIAGTPVWASNVSVPVRTYLAENRGRFKAIAFFCSAGGSAGKSFASMEEICGLRPKGVLEVITKDMASGAYLQKVEEFGKAIKAHNRRKSR